LDPPTSCIAIPDSFIYIEDERGSKLFFVSKGECMMDWTGADGVSDSDDSEDECEVKADSAKGKVVVGGARGYRNDGGRRTPSRTSRTQGRPFEDKGKLNAKDEDEGEDEGEGQEEENQLRYNMTQGAVFGELVLLGNKIRQETVIAKSFVELEVLMLYYTHTLPLLTLYSHSTHTLLIFDATLYSTGPAQECLRQTFDGACEHEVCT
jgi:hypothetical protein